MGDRTPQRCTEIEASGDRAVAAEEIHGAVSTGDNSPVDYRVIKVEPGTLRASAEVNLKGALTNLPDGPAAVFVGRGSALAQLDRELSRDRARVVIGQVIHGLGGVGKTELARQYAAAYRDRYQLRWWISGESAEQIQAGLTGLAERLHPPVALALTAEQAADWARGWLQAHEGWLLVLDNVENPVHVRDLLGQLHTGHILITTRRLVPWPTGIHALHLEVLDELAAAALVAMVGEQDRPEERPAIEAIATELGYLPLALNQAGAYIRESRISPGEYLALLTAHPVHMYAASPAGGDAERTIARLWRVHLDTIGKRSAYTVHLLRVLACYAPDDIPRDILGTESDRPLLLDALRLLHSYSLITLTEKTVSVHRLIQAVAAGEDGNLTGPEEGSASRVALAWLVNAWTASAELPPPERHIRRRVLSPHVESLIRHYPASSESQGNVQIFHEAANYERDEGNYHRALTFVSHALAVDREALGEEHPNTLTCRSNLAVVLRALGQLEEAETENRAVLEARRRMLGEEHPDTLASRSHLALVSWELGRLEEAEAEHRAVLEICCRVLGEEDPNTLACRGNLAVVLSALERLEEAETENRAVLEARRRVLGEEHPDTLASRNNLAFVLWELGRLGEAEAEHRAVLEICRRVLGEEHPNTLACRGNLALVLRALGRLEEAETENRAVLEARRRVLGEEHPKTLAGRNNLAFVLWELGRLGEAEAEHRAVLEICRRVLGEEHPNTLASRNNLALVLRALGRLKEEPIPE